jgi:hypothetical protein
MSASDRHQSYIASKRKRTIRAVEWAQEQAPGCTTDAMKARLLDALLEKVEHIWKAKGRPD